MKPKRGWRVHWTHPQSGDQMSGELWPDRATAEDIAEMCRRGGMLHVHIERGAREANDE